ncbi:DNA-binding transcriptional LysR family regulator [Oxalobacteraceae bacterium GrIS 1.11]
MRFDLIDLRLFLHVCEAGSITGGAERSHLTLQSASERIRGMEDELGAPLLLRTKAGVKLTDAGRSLIHHARIVLLQMDDMRGELRQYGKGLHGNIRLLCNTSAFSEYLPEVLAAYLSVNPKISVKIEEKLSYQIIHAIKNKTTEIGIVANSVNLDGLESIPFRDDKLVLVVPENSHLAEMDVIAFENIIDLEFIGLIDGSALQEHISNHAKQLGKRLKYRVQLQNFDAVCRMVECGLGVGIVPKNAAVRSMKYLKIRAVELSDQWAARELVICAESFEALPKYFKEFIAFIAGEANGDAEKTVVCKPDLALSS